MKYNNITLKDAGHTKTIRIQHQVLNAKEKRCVFRSNLNDGIGAGATIHQYIKNNTF